MPLVANPDTLQTTGNTIIVGRAGAVPGTQSATLGAITGSQATRKSDNTLRGTSGATGAVTGSTAIGRIGVLARVTSGSLGAVSGQTATRRTGSVLTPATGRTGSILGSSARGFATPLRVKSGAVGAIVGSTASTTATPATTPPLVGPWVGEILVTVAPMAPVGTPGLPTTQTIQNAWTACDQWVRQHSYNRAWLGVTVLPWISDNRVSSLTISNAFSGTNDMFDILQTAHPSPPTHDLTAFYPVGHGIGVPGLGDPTFFAFFGDLSSFGAVWCREFLRAMGLDTADALQMAGGDPIPDPPWTIVAAGDPDDPMATADRTWPNTADLYQLGWLQEDWVKTNSAGSVNLRSPELGGTPTQGVAARLWRVMETTEADGGFYDLWVEKRANVAFGHRARLARRSGHTLLLDGQGTGTGAPSGDPFVSGSAPLVLPDGRTCSWLSTSFSVAGDSIYEFVDEIVVLVVPLAVPGSTGLPSNSTIESAWANANSWIVEKSYGRAFVTLLPIEPWRFDSRVGTANNLNDLITIVEEIPGLPYRHLTAIYPVGETMPPLGEGIRGWFWVPQTSFTNLFCHELNHALGGINHASTIGRVSGNPFPPAPWAPGSVGESGDNYAPVGNGPSTGWPTTAHMEFISWLVPSRISVDPTGSVAVTQLEASAGTSGFRAVKLTGISHAEAVGGFFDVWIERRSVGWQARLAWYGGFGLPTSTVLLDGVGGAGPLGEPFPVSSSLALPDGRNVEFTNSTTVTIT